MSILENQTFRDIYDRLAGVRLNPRRHTAPHARAHSDLASEVAFRLGGLNGCTEAELGLLADLGHAHDIGKVTGSARPEHSLRVLQECTGLAPELLALIKWHDVGLPWFQAARRGQAPSDKAWRQLAREVDLRLLCIFMVADRSDAPGGWRRNGPTLWFLEQARTRGLISELKLDLPDHPSLISVGCALVRGRVAGLGREVLLVRASSGMYALPGGAVEWDESPEDAARRHAGGQLSVPMDLVTRCHLGDLDQNVEAGDCRVLERVRYYLLSPVGPGGMSALAEGSGERVWVSGDQLSSTSLTTPSLHSLVLAAVQD